MTPLPAALSGGASELVVWRLDREVYADAWESGEGAFRGGGRWNSRGVRAVYCAIDPATAILEVAVHKTFDVLDAVPHTLTSVTILEPAAVHVVQPDAIANPNWLRPGLPSAAQQRYGDDLLARHKFVVLPSVVSTTSWNLIFLAGPARGAYARRTQERFALDTRLNPVAS